MSRFDLSIKSFTRPTLPRPPTDLNSDAIRSPLLPSTLAATSSLYITINLPCGRNPKNPLAPATHLQLVYAYQGTGEIFIPNLITSSRLIQTGTDSDTYEIEVTPEDIPRAKVNPGTTATANLFIYAWKREKILGKWAVGEIEGLGNEGLKSFELHARRMESWKRDGYRGHGKDVTDTAE